MASGFSFGPRGPVTERGFVPGAGRPVIRAARDTPPTPAAVPFYAAPPAVPPLDVVHRERRGLGPAQPAARQHGWRFARPDARGQWLSPAARCPPRLPAFGPERLQ
jgi:hypothetical protein